MHSHTHTHTHTLPPLSRDFIDGFTSSVPSPITPINSHRLRQSPEAFPLELGSRMRRHFGLRTSRSYDLLSDAQTDGGTPNSKQANGRCLADGDWRTQSSYGVSPRYEGLSFCTHYILVLWGNKPVVLFLPFELILTVHRYISFFLLLSYCVHCETIQLCYTSHVM